GGGEDVAAGAKEFIHKLVQERAEFVRQKGEAAHGPLMGPVMKEWRGKVDGEKLAQMLREEIASLLSSK
ncbi:MAG TPA: Glu-tRNA(Gln) amidotransferase GatDE subunit E, partial [Thermoplasmata archaeon]|nr:Glu-tRNA(Gln) amidotransferase GatDE subunit E [Thermoplasmata archaeon]